MMKLPVAALLLLCACGLQAALTKREAVPEAGAEAPPDAAIPLSRHFQTFSDFVTKELPQKLQAEELRNQAKYWGGLREGTGGLGDGGTPPGPPLTAPLFPPPAGPIWSRPTSS